MSNPVIAVTLPTYNVLTETNVNHFIFDSQYNTFKIIVRKKVKRHGAVGAGHGEAFAPVGELILGGPGHQERLG